MPRKLGPADPDRILNEALHLLRKETRRLKRLSSKAEACDSCGRRPGLTEGEQRNLVLAVNALRGIARDKIMLVKANAKKSPEQIAAELAALETEAAKYEQ